MPIFVFESISVSVVGISDRHISNCRVIKHRISFLRKKEILTFIDFS